MNSVHAFIEKIKAFFGREDVFIIFVSVLFSLTVFGGLLLYSERKQAFEVIVEENAFPVLINNIQQEGTGTYFMASKNGTKYYPRGCNAGNRVKEKNRIYFSSINEAVSAGYALAKNCK